MAFLREAAGFGGQSGVLGNVVLAQTEVGTVMRARPRGSRHRSEAQAAQDHRMRTAKLRWEALSDDDVAAWRGYALAQAAASPRGSRERMTSAWSHFSGLGTKFMQLHGGSVMPSRPPEGAFVGDALRVSVAGGAEEAIFTSEGSNRSGMVTEILAQRLSSRHNATRPRSYTSLGFVAFEVGVPVALPLGYGLYWAFAARFVEASTGRMTEFSEIGRATVNLSPTELSQAVLQPETSAAVVLGLE